MDWVLTMCLSLWRLWKLKTEKPFSALQRLSSMFDTLPLSWNTFRGCSPLSQVALALRKTDPTPNYSSGTWMLQNNLHNPTLFAIWLVQQNKTQTNQHILFFLGTEWPNQCRAHIFLGNLLLDRQEMVTWILEMLGHFGKPGWGEGQKGTLLKTKYKIENDINRGTSGGPTFGLTVYMNQQII